MHLAVIHRCRNHAIERRRPIIAYQPEDSIEDVFASQDVFLTDKLSKDVMSPRQPSPRHSELVDNVSTGCATHKVSRLRKIKSSANWSGPPVQKSFVKQKALVNFSMKKNELMSNHIISNIRSILKNIETRKDLSSSSLGINGRFSGRQPEQRKSVTTNRRLMCRVLDNSLGQTHIYTTNNGMERSQSRVLQCNRDALNRVSALDGDLSYPRKQLALVSKPRSISSQRVDKENIHWQNKKMKMKMKAINKENDGHTSKATVAIDKLALSIVDRGITVARGMTSTINSNQSNDVRRTIKDLSVCVSGGRKESGRLRNQFKIRSTTTNAIDRLVRQSSATSIVDDFVN